MLAHTHRKRREREREAPGYRPYNFLRFGERLLRYCSGYHGDQGAAIVTHPHTPSERERSLRYSREHPPPSLYCTYTTLLLHMAQDGPNVSRERRKPKNDWILVAASDVLFIFYHIPPSLLIFPFFNQMKESRARQGRRSRERCTRRRRRRSRGLSRLTQTECVFSSQCQNCTQVVTTF